MYFFFSFSKLRNLPLFSLCIWSLERIDPFSLFNCISSFFFQHIILVFFLLLLHSAHTCKSMCCRISNLEFARVVAVGLRKHGTFFINASLTLILLETFVFIAIFESFIWKEVLSHFSFRFISWRTNDQNEMTNAQNT